MRIAIIGGAIMSFRSHSPHDGFSLIELLIVVAVIGLVAAIAVPNLINAIQRSRQSRTVGDARLLGQAIEMYQQDYSYYPIATGISDIEVVRPYLGSYVGNFNAEDGWRKAFLYSCDGTHYTIISYGGNGVADTPYSPGPTQSFDADVVFADGSFFQWPQGIQSQ